MFWVCACICNNITKSYCSAHGLGIWLALKCGDSGAPWPLLLNQELPPSRGDTKASEQAHENGWLRNLGSNGDRLHDHHCVMTSL